ncbi:MAG: dihydrofolate reductase [Lachnospiraceae bacterium]
MVYAIVTADRNWGIGKDGRPITSIPDDTRYIRAATSGNVAIMGRKTFESIPAVRLPVDRTNIVLSTNTGYEAKGCMVAHSPEEAMQLAAGAGGDIYVLGGGSVFAAMLPYFDEVQVTYVDYIYDVDTVFPNLDKLPQWVQVTESEEMTHFDTVYYIRKYLKRHDYRN